MHVCMFSDRRILDSNQFGNSEEGITSQVDSNQWMRVSKIIVFSEGKYGEKMEGMDKQCQKDTSFA